MSSKNPISLYIHWPFCLKKCPYCDFNSHVSYDIDQELWLKSLKQEMRFYKDQTDGRLMKTIFFGGGTPSLMEPFVVEGLIDEAASLWNFANDIEISMEANPTSSEAENFKAYKQAGVNRLSIGVQSLKDKDLQFLGREHSALEAKQVIELAANIFDNYSFDLIYARPDQSLKGWEAELKEALNLNPHHISLYQLTIEKGTQFYTQHLRGDFEIPEEGLASDLYEMTIEMLDDKGFEHYEISNFAKHDKQAKHNIVYWQYDDYLGIGPGAHGRYSKDGVKYATQTHKNPASWLNLIQAQGSGLKNVESLEQEDIIKETLMMGLRLKQGIHLGNFYDKTNVKLLDVLDHSKVQALQNNGDLESNHTYFRLSKQGRMRLNLILEYLL